MMATYNPPPYMRLTHGRGNAGAADNIPAAGSGGATSGPQYQSYAQAGEYLPAL